MNIGKSSKNVEFLSVFHKRMLPTAVAFLSQLCMESNVVKTKNQVLEK